MLTNEYPSSSLPGEAHDIWHGIFGDVLRQEPTGPSTLGVSSDMQADKNSLPSQLRELLIRAKGEGVYVRPEDIFWEVYTGDELWERPELTRMRGLFESRPFDCVYFYSVDRFARKAFYAELVLDEARAAGIEADFVTEKFQTTPEGKLLRRADEYVAEGELHSLGTRPISFLR
jgi:DNA invertase Pin-like site-specific DNA recombinase